MISVEQGRKFAREWVKAWNDRNLDEVLSHYTDDFEMSTPFIASMYGEPSGTLRGRENVAKYWTAALAKLPDLHFELRDVLVGVNSVVIYYKSVMNKSAAEVFTFDESGKVCKAAAHYDSL